MKSLVFPLLLLLLSPFVIGESTMEDFMQEEGEFIESRYNVQTMITKENAYIILETDNPGRCEYDTDEFEYGDGNEFETINGTIHRVKIETGEGQSYRFKIKCVVEGKDGEENIIFSVSHISFFLLERLDELKSKVSDFKTEKSFYEEKVEVTDLGVAITELEKYIQESEESIKKNDIDKLRNDISNSIRKQNEIENILYIKSIQLTILDSSRYIVAGIILVYLFLYILTSFTLPYWRVIKNLNKLKNKENEMTKLRQNTEMLYFNRNIDEDTFNKMVVKEQEEIMRIRVKIKNLREKRKEMVKGVFKPKTMIEWSLRERIHIKDKLKKVIDIIKRKIK